MLGNLEDRMKENIDLPLEVFEREGRYCSKHDLSRQRI